MGMFDFLKRPSSYSPGSSSGALESAHALQGLMGAENSAEVMARQLSSNAPLVDAGFSGEEQLWFLNKENQELYLHLKESERIYRMAGCDLMAWFVRVESFTLGHTSRGLEGKQQSILVYRKVAIEDSTKQPPRERKPQQRPEPEEPATEIRA